VRDRVVGLPEFRHGSAFELAIDAQRRLTRVASELLPYTFSEVCTNMRLPFSKEDFFDVFAAYNSASWPAVVALWVASVLASVSLLSSRRSHDRWISGLLAVHWAWSAVAYHVAFFTRINPAAWLFAATFLLQALLFLWSGVIRGRLSFMGARTTWTAIGWFLVVYALLYPAINAVEHGSVLKIPTFGLPCPTTIFTAGLLLLAAPHSRTLAIIPIVWSVIGGSAAFLLGVSADYVLLVAGVALAVFELQSSSSLERGVSRSVGTI
jgi:hypothetical protein